MKKSTLSQTEQVDITRRFGIKALGYAAVGLATTGVMPDLLKFAISDANAAAAAKHKLRFGTIIAPKADKYLASGMYHLAKAIEEKSDGEISVQMLDKAQVCAETVCANKVSTGVIDIGSASSTNLSLVAAFSNAIDWPMMWSGRDEIFNFLFSPESEKLYRSVMRKTYGIEVLHYYGDMRSIYMGLKYSDRDEIRTPEAFAGAKIRISGSEMFENFTKSLGMNPIPLAWVETLEGMKSGVVDAMETFPSAAAGYGMTKVSAQAVDVNFSPGVCPAFISSRSMDKMSDRLKEVVYEAAWEAQKLAYADGITTNNEVVGSGDNPGADSNYQKLDMRDVRLTASERAAFAEAGGVEQNMEMYGSMRGQMDKIGGYDVYAAMKEQAAHWVGKPINMQKWWT